MLLYLGKDLKDSTDPTMRAYYEHRLKSATDHQVLSNSKRNNNILQCVTNGDRFPGTVTLNKTAAQF